MNADLRPELASVEVDLTRLEPMLAESVIFGDAYLDAVTTHLIHAGGKRLRPLLAIAVGDLAASAPPPPTSYSERSRWS